MAVIISDNANPAYDGNLSTANGFYTVSAHNLGLTSNTDLVISTTRIIPVTFNHTANMRGICLAFSFTTILPTSYRDVDVIFQENVSGTWTTRLTRTLDSDMEISNGLNAAGIWIIPVTFSSTWAVDTTANKWRFTVASASGAQSTHWTLATSDATNPFYATWVDVQATATTTADALVIKDKIIQDISFSTKSVAVTGYALAGVSCVVCKEANPDPSIIGNWEVNDFTTQKTLGVDGYWYMSSHGGMRIGSPTNRPTNPNFFDIRSLPASIGTRIGVICSGSGIGRTGAKDCRSSFIAYGAYPAKVMTRTTAQASTGATSIDVEDASFMNVGDYIAIGRRAGVTATEAGKPRHLITGISGNTVTFSTGLVTSLAYTGAWVIVERNDTTGPYQGLRILVDFATTSTWSNFVLDGAVCYPYRTYGGSNNLGPVEESQNTIGLQFKNSIYVSNNSTTGYATTYTNYWNGMPPPNTDIIIENCYGFGCSVVGQITQLTAINGPNSQQYICNNFIIRDCYSSTLLSNFILLNINAGTKLTIENSVFDGLGAGSTTLNLAGSSLGLAKDVWVWGANNSAVVAAVTFGFCSSENLNVGNCTSGIMLGGGIHKNLILGEERANTSDFIFRGYANHSSRIKGTVGNPTFDTTYLQSGVAGARSFFENVNAPQVDFTVAPEGYTYRTGAGLADTTTRTTGSYALRFESIRTDRNLVWSHNIPTGDIQGKTMTVGIWVKINSATYWAGTNQMPRLTVNYDDGTEAYGEASQTTDWQFVFVPVTPTTTFGQLGITLSTNTDATGSDAYVYFQDFTAPLPQGSELNLGGMSLWSEGLPIIPLSFATSVSAADVWAADPTQFGAGTVGKKVNDIKNDTGLIPSLL